MKCKYCRTKIGLLDWIFLLRKCSGCDDKISSKKHEKMMKKFNKQEEDSNKYWEQRNLNQRRKK